jgi:hypothetical protein
MSRLRLPNFTFAAPPATPSAPTPARAVRVLLGRREFLKALGATSVLLLAPWTRVERAWAAAKGRFFTKSERATLEALVDTIIPPDDEPGAAELGVVRYVEGLLTAFDERTPRLFAGGPFSNRNPFIDFDTGTPARRRSRNSFKRFVPPNRLQALYWHWQLVGTAGLDAGERALIEPLDAQIGAGPLLGLRDVYRTGLEQLDALSRTEEGAPFLDLDQAARERVREAARVALPNDPRRGKNFLGLVVQHTMEGMFAAPEYGGNRKLGGWRLSGIEGDSQPLGYALYSKRDDAYHERADHPLSTPNPDEIAGPAPLSPVSNTVQQLIVAGAGIFPDEC